MIVLVGCDYIIILYNKCFHIYMCVHGLSYIRPALLLLLVLCLMMLAICYAMLCCAVMCYIYASMAMFQDIVSFMIDSFCLASIVFNELKIY
jgi:hypothetical protein